MPVHARIVLTLALTSLSCGDPATRPSDTGLPPQADIATLTDMGSQEPDGAVELDTALRDSGAPDAATDVTPDVPVEDAYVDAPDLTDMNADDLGDPDDMAVTSLAVVIDSDGDGEPTPINSAYVAEIDATVSGDRIISYQKYFRSEPVITALMDAARRGVDVLGIYGDDVDPSCTSLLVAGDTINCSSMFVESLGSHHKNMMVLRADGTARGIIGSYNPRVRSTSSPRAHTVLLFEVANAQPLFDFYTAEADRLTSTATAQPLTMSVPIAAGGEITLTFHPGVANPVLDLLNSISSCDGTLWLSYFDVLPDMIATPVFNRLQQLVGIGCDVRVLLSNEATNNLARLALISRGVPVEFPDYPGGDGTIGHKIVSVVSNGEAHLMQGSANLNIVNHNVNHNLSVHVRATSTELNTAIETELLRYWP